MPGQVPSFVNESLWHTPQAWTLILTSRLPGSGISRSVIWKSAPGSGTCATFIVATAIVEGVIKPPSGLNTRRGGPGAAVSVRDFERTLDVDWLPASVLALAPEPERDGRCTDAQTGQRHVRQPRWQDRIHVEPSVWRVRLQAENRLHEMKDRSGCPCLRHVCARIEHRKRARSPPQPRVELGQT